MCKMTIWILFILIFTVVEQLVSGKGDIKITVLSYENPSGRDADGNCSSGALTKWPKLCEENSNYNFVLCLSKLGDRNCTYGSHSLSGPSDKNSFNFTSNNILTFDFDQWEGGFAINITVIQGSQKSVDTFQEIVNISDIFPHSLVKPKPYTFHGKRHLNATTIRIGVLPKCSINYYLGNCTKYCHGHISCDGHYTCNSKGDKECKPGWMKPDCKIPEANSSYSCLPQNGTVYTGEFTSSTWKGTTVCSNGTNGNVTLQLSRDNYNASHVLGTVLIDNQSTEVSGSYAPLSNGYVDLFSNDTKLNISMKKVTWTSLGGSVVMQGLHCNISLMQTSAKYTNYTDPCRNAGVCYRISQTPYCCCDDGSNGSTCSPKVSSTSVTHTTKRVSYTKTTITKQESSIMTSTVSSSIHTSAAVSSSLTSHSTTHSASTTETPKPFVPGMKYEVILEALEEELDVKRLQDLITEAWLYANIKLNKTDIHITVLYMEDAIGENRNVVTVVNYNVTILSYKINKIIIVEPTIYNTNVYRGRVLFSVKSTFSIYFQGRPPLLGLWTNISEEIQRVWKNNSSLAKEAFWVLIVAVEDYVESELSGKDVTRVYYVLCNGSSSASQICYPVHPSTQPASTRFRTIVTRQVYSGNVTLLLRSRLSFNLDIYGYVFKSDFKAIIKKLQELWNSTGKSEYLLRSPHLENDYSGEKGEYLSRIRYFVNSSGRLISHIFQTKPSTEQCNSALSALGSLHGAQYRVYSGKMSYRYSSLLTLYVKDQVNEVDFTRFRTALEQLWIGKFGSDTMHYRIHIVYTRAFIHVDGGRVSQILYRISSENNDTVDGSQLSPLSFSSLQKNVHVRKGNGDVYKVVQQNKVLEERSLFDFYIQGVVNPSDTDFIQLVLYDSWEKILNVKATELNITVVRIGQLLKIDDLENTNQKFLISKIYYLVANKTSSHNINSYRFLAMKPENIVNIINTSNSEMTKNSKYEKLKLYIVQKNESLVSIEYSYHLMFETEVARLQYNTLKQALQNTLKTYLGTRGDVSVTIYSQDEYYVPYNQRAHQYTTSSTYWKLNFLIKEDNKLIYPTAVKKLNISYFSHHLNVTGLNHKPYLVYVGNTSGLLPPEYQLKLLFTSMVHVNDWKLIQSSIQTAWKTQLNIYVRASIENVEEVVDQSGKTYWRLFYYLRKNGKLVYAGNWNHLDSNLLTFKFTNFYGNNYTCVSLNVKLWRVSKAFQLATYQPLNKTKNSALENALALTWCESIAVRYSTCKDHIGINMISQTRVKLPNGVYMWLLYYVMLYDGKMVDSSTWPDIDISKLSYHLGNQLHVKFTSTAHLDLSFSNQQYVLHLTSQVKKEDYDVIKQAIKSTWIKDNAGIAANTKLEIIFNTQDRVFTSTGRSEWVLRFHLRVNGSTVRPDLSQSINTTILQQQLAKTGHRYHVVLNPGKQIPKDPFSSLYIKSWVHPTDIQKFKKALETFYTNKTAHAKITVKIGPIVETIPKTGDSIWKLPYLVLVNGSVQQPEHLDKPSSHDLTTWFTITSEFGVEYKLESEVSTYDKASLFYIDVSHRVTKRWYGEVEKLLKNILLKSNPVFATCEECVLVKLRKQDEIVTLSGQIAWRLHYSVFIDGTEVHSGLKPLVNMTALKGSDLTFKGINGVTITILDTHRQETMAMLPSLHFLYLDKLLATANEADVKSAIKEIWTAALGKNITVVLGQNKEYIQQNGVTVWRLDYFLKLNSKTLTTDMIPPLNSTQKKVLKQSISKLRSPRNETYTVTDQNIHNLREYDMHFPLCFTNKVAKKDIVKIQKEIKETWSVVTGLNLSSIDIAMTEQKEMLDKQGTSVWTLFYFLTMNNTIVDSRSTEFRNVTQMLKHKLSLLTDVQGNVYNVITSTPTLYRYDHMFSVFLSGKLDQKAEMEFKTVIQTIVKNKTKGTDVKVTVERQEEYKTNKMQTLWKAVFTVNVDGKQLLPASFLFPHHYFNLTNNRGETIALLSSANHVYNLRNAFSLYFTRNISYHSWHDIEVALLKEWYMVDEYKNCSCLNITNWIVKETVDMNGQTIYRLLYFLTVNNTDVNSMTATHLAFPAVLKALENVTDFDGSKLKPVRLTQDKVISVNYLFKVVADKPIIISHIKMIESALLVVLKNSTPDCCSEVVLKKQLKMVEFNGKVKWLLEFLVSKDGKTLDASVSPPIATDILQNEINLVFHGQYNYTVYSVDHLQLLDSRHHLSFVFSAPLVDNQITEIKKIIQKELTKINLNVIVNITSQEEFVNKWSFSVWKLDVYLYRNSPGDSVIPYIPAWGLDGNLVDLKHMQSLIRNLTFVGSHGIKLLDLHDDDLIAYSNINKFYVNQAVLKSDEYHLMPKLASIWTQMIQGFMDQPYVNTKIVRQEECIDLDGNMLSKVTYTVSTNGITVLSQTLPSINSNLLENMLREISSRNRQYTLVTEHQIYDYDQLFFLYLEQPVLPTDISMFEQQLKVILRGEAKILFQEEVFTTQSPTKAWKVSYSLTSHTSIQDVKIHGNLNKQNMTNLLQTISSKGNAHYSSAVVNEMAAFYRLSETLTLYVTKRVAPYDHIKFEAALKKIWVDELSNNITILVTREEEIVNNYGVFVYAIGYVILQREHVLSPKTLPKVFVGEINVTNHLGKQYIVTTLEESFRVEECLHLYLSQPLLRHHRTDVINDIELAFRRLADELQNVTLEWKGQTKFLSSSQRSAIWRQLFVIKLNNKVIDYQRYQHLKAGEITLNVTSSNGNKYVDKTDSVIGYYRADMLFSITVIGRIQIDHIQYFQDSINASWLKIINDVTIHFKPQEELVGDNGIVITRLPYFVAHGSSVTDPEVFPSINYSAIIDKVSPRVQAFKYVLYTGDKDLMYSSCFGVLIKGSSEHLDLSSVRDVLTTTWKNNINTPYLEINIINTEQFVGDFGIQITNVVYTVTADKVLASPDTDVTPPTDTIQSNIHGVPWHLYRGTTRQRLHTSYTIQIVNNGGELPANERHLVEQALLDAWNTNTTKCKQTGMQCDITVSTTQTSIGYPSTDGVSNGTKYNVVSKVFYSIKSDVMFRPWMTKSPSLTVIHAILYKLNPLLEVWTKLSVIKVRIMFLTGYTVRLDRSKVTAALRMAWHDQSNLMKASILHVQRYTDKNWNLISKIEYFVQINGTNPEEFGLKSPKESELKKSLKTSGVGGELCSSKALKHRKLYLYDHKGEHNHSVVAEAITAAWVDKNNETKELVKITEVHIKQSGKARRKRAAVAGSGFVDSNGDTVVPIDYTVSVDNQEPNSLFVTEPTDDEIRQHLQDAGVKDCDCEPSKTGTVKLKGVTGDHEKNDITDAIAKAVAAANPDIKPNDLDVKILDIKNDIKDEKGNPISLVTYAIRRKDGDIIDALKHPSDGQMVKALKQTGRVIAGTPDPVKDEGADWEVPLGIVCAVLGAILVIGIIVYLVHSRRQIKRDKLLKEDHTDLEMEIRQPEYSNLQGQQQHPTQEGFTIQYNSRDEALKITRQDHQAFVNPTYELPMSAEKFEQMSHL